METEVHYSTLQMAAAVRDGPPHAQCAPVTTAGWISSHRQPTSGGPLAWKLWWGLKHCCPKKIKLLYSVTGKLRGSSLRSGDTRVNKSRWARNVARMGEKRSAYVLIEKYGCKKPLWRPMCRWVDNTETGFQDRMSGHRLDSAGWGQGQVAGCCKHGNEPSGSIKYEEMLAKLMKKESTPCN